MPITDYCRQIEAYLCQKNDGHLIRITGPSFDLVSAWSERGVPLKVAFAGIDRCFQRYYAKGPRRRPVRVDFCEADVLDVFDEWRRATGLALGDSTEPSDDGADGRAVRRGPSLPGHLERVVTRLTAARVADTLDAGFDNFVDRVARELDEVRGARGPKRQAVVDRLAALDRELVAAVRAKVDASTLAELGREADEELAGFRSRLNDQALSRAREAAIDRLLRERLHLPTIAFT